jgi:TolB-like protein
LKLARLRSYLDRAALAAILLVGASCASFAPARRAAVAIDAADREAKLAVANEAAIDAGKIPARSVSVLPFLVSERDTLLRPLSYAMSSFLLGDLSRSPQLQLVERERIDAIYRELALVDEGATDPRTAPRVGKLVGARRVVVGSITPAGNGQIVISARVVDVLSGTVQEVSGGTATLERIFDAEKALAFRLLDQLGVSLSPAERASIEAKQTSNVAAAVAFGRGAEAEARGDVAAAVRAFQDAARLDIGFAAARTAATRVQLTATTANASGAAAKADAIARVLDVTAQAINTAVVTKLPEAADVPLQSFVFTLLLTLRIF